ncbi:MAG: hypothetical protein ABJ308_06730 [Halieaceae bacterium]
MHRLSAILGLGLLAACAGSQAPLPSPIAAPAEPTQARSTDFAGHWEMDYSRSDNVDDKLQRLYREWQRAAERRANMDRRGQNNPAYAVNTNPRGFRSLLDVARLADLITSSQVLEIKQSDQDIEIQRENDFALSCVFTEGEPEIVVAELGAEICGWAGHQLVFRMQLPDGLDIVHRVTMSLDGERLHIATQVDSKSSQPFTLDRYYYRFDPLPDDYSCEYTLSRGNVCQSESP